MAKVWVLDTETKGTGAEMVPLEKVLKDPPQPRRRRKRASSAPAPQRRVEAAPPPPPPGHVRKKATGELGRVRAVDAKAGTVTVSWLKSGQTSTVPLTAVARR